ncbi:MAG: reverse transcriptase family protein [Azonexus sp.]
MDEFSDDPEFPELPEKAMRQVAVALTRAFLAGEVSPVGMRQRGGIALGQAWPWLVPLSLHLHFELGDELQPGEHDRIVALILAYPRFRSAFAVPGERPKVRGHFPFHPPMGTPPPALAGLDLPVLATPGELADWLGLTPGELDWFSNAWHKTATTAQLDHYHYRWLAKRSGGARLIEAPKENLRALQRRILHGILDRVPVHAAAMGCVKGRSVLDNARRHCAAPLLLKMDLRDFFVSIPARRVHALFRSLGYPSATARCLTGLTTHATPTHLLRQVPQAEYPSPEERRQRQQWARQFMERHLPQGAPTSPALANLCAYRLDLRLTGAARACQAHYSRYVDDLAFSCADGNPAHGRRLLNMLQDIILEEGFTPNWRKTRLAPAATTQRITGLVVNAHPNLPRQDYDRLKAILTNCQHHGPDSQNRDGRPDFRAHLQGRIAWCGQVNAGRGEKLQALFERINWAEAR